MGLCTRARSLNEQSNCVSTSPVCCVWTQKKRKNRAQNFREREFRVQTNERFERSTTLRNNSHQTKSKSCVEWTMKVSALVSLVLLLLLLLLLPYVYLFIDMHATMFCVSLFCSFFHCFPYVSFTYLPAIIYTDSCPMRWASVYACVCVCVRECVLVHASHFWMLLQLCYVPWPIWYVIETSLTRCVFFASTLLSSLRFKRSRVCVSVFCWTITVSLKRELAPPITT